MQGYFWTEFIFNEKLIHDEQGGFRSGRGCVNEMFTLKQLGEKHKRRR